jgi:hypothetical protein
MNEAFEIGWHPIRRDSTISDGKADWYYVCALFHNKEPMGMTMFGPFRLGEQNPPELVDHMNKNVGTPDLMLPKPFLNMMVWGKEEKGEQEAYSDEFNEALENAPRATAEIEKMVQEIGSPMYEGFIAEMGENEDLIKEWKEQVNAEAEKQTRKS